MRKLYLLLLFSHVSSPVKHSLMCSSTTSSGIPDFPEFVADVQVDNIQTFHCNFNTKTAEPRQDWMKNYFDSNPQHLDWYTGECLGNSHKIFKDRMYTFMQQFNQSGGVHILQRINGCEWDEETEEVTGIVLYGYDGEDFLSLDLKTETWIALKPEAVAIKQEWDADIERMKRNEDLLTQMCPELLKKYLDYRRSSLLRTALPSVSLLQKTPSSPVSCHATGFYPDRAMMFWRKDGEDLDEDVDRGEILPNHDGTFQMRADLKVSSVSPEDWRRYDCVFKFFGVKERIITRLDKAKIRTNWAPPQGFSTGAVIGGVVAVVVVVVVLLIYKRVHKHQRGEQGCSFNYTLQGSCCVKTTPASDT